jgi:hypothetical protein
VERQRLRNARRDGEDRRKRDRLRGARSVRAIRDAADRRRVRQQRSFAGEARKLGILLEQTIDGRDAARHGSIGECEKNRGLREPRSKKSRVDLLEQADKRLLLVHDERGQEGNLHDYRADRTRRSIVRRSRVMTAFVDPISTVS